MRKLFIIILTILGFSNSSLAGVNNTSVSESPVIGEWTVQDYREQSGMVLFIFPLNENDVLKVTAYYEPRTITVSMDNDGEYISSSRLKRIVSWDSMGRMEQEVLLTPEQFNLMDFVDFFSNETSFSLNWDETGHMDDVKIQPNSAAVFLPYLKDLSTFKFVY